MSPSRVDAAVSFCEGLVGRARFVFLWADRDGDQVEVSFLGYVRAPLGSAYELVRDGDAIRVGWPMVQFGPATGPVDPSPVGWGLMDGEGNRLVTHRHPHLPTPFMRGDVWRVVPRVLLRVRSDVREV